MYSAADSENPQVLWKLNIGGRTIPVTDDDVESMIVGAFEGGSNYWIDNVHIVNAYFDKRLPDTAGSTWAAFSLLHDGMVIVYEQNEGDDKEPDYGSPDPYGQTILTLSMIERGFRMFFEHRAKQRHGIDGYLYPDGTIDMGSVDAGDADGIFQFALWGEWIYG